MDASVLNKPFHGHFGDLAAHGAVG
jgi:hypothetical protein